MSITLPFDFDQSGALQNSGGNFRLVTIDQLVSGLHLQLHDALTAISKGADPDQYRSVANNAIIISQLAQANTDVLIIDNTPAKSDRLQTLLDLPYGDAATAPAAQAALDDVIQLVATGQIFSGGQVEAAWKAGDAVLRLSGILSNPVVHRFISVAHPELDYTAIVDQIVERQQLMDEQQLLSDRLSDTRRREEIQLKIAEELRLRSLLDAAATGKAESPITPRKGKGSAYAQFAAAIGGEEVADMLSGPDDTFDDNYADAEGFFASLFIDEGEHPLIEQSEWNTAFTAYSDTYCDLSDPEYLPEWARPTVASFSKGTLLWGDALRQFADDNGLDLAGADAILVKNDDTIVQFKMSTGKKPRLRISADTGNAVLRPDGTGYAVVEGKPQAPAPAPSLLDTVADFPATALAALNSTDNPQQFRR
jgi:hypothetical protein